MNNKLLLIDMHIELATKLTAYLENEGYQVTLCHDGITGLDLVQANHYQLIIIDIMLPKPDGFEVIKRLRAINNTPIVVLTDRDEHFDRIYALEIGADDYLSKSINQRELLARIKAIIRRTTRQETTQTESKLAINDISLCLLNREAYCNNQKLPLTSLEFEVLYLLMSNAGKVTPKDKIGEHVLGRTISYYDRSIDMHISNIRKKIAHLAENKKIKTIRGAGYLFMVGNA